MAHRRNPPLSKEQLELCPYGIDSCRICQLLPEQIKEVHDAKFNNNATYDQLRKLMREKFSIGEDYTRISQHFNQHVLGKEELSRVLIKARHNIPYPEIARALEPITDSIKVTTNQDLERAYEYLIKMAEKFVNRVGSMQDRLDIHINTRAAAGVLDDEFKRSNAMDLLEKQGKLQKEAREFIKEVSMLRAPKVMVAQMLESFIDSVIKEMSTILGNIAAEVKYEILETLAKKGHDNLVNEAEFIGIFKGIAKDYRDRMLHLKRKQLSDAMAVLSDLEKIV
jgi:hypothetical protein